jgi:hypothetical protein
MAAACSSQPDMLVTVALDDQTLIEPSDPSADRRSARVYLGDVGFGAITVWITPRAADRLKVAMEKALLRLREPSEGLTDG